MIAVTRRYRFPAAHVLRSPELAEAENERIYGKCANPEGHGHDYGVEVTVTGRVDERTGWIIPPERLDAIVEQAVVRRFGYGLLNEDECFREAVPTAENIVLAIRELLEAPVAEEGARLAKVRLIETRRNEFEWGRDR